MTDQPPNQSNSEWRETFESRLANYSSTFDDTFEGAIPYMFGPVSEGSDTAMIVVVVERLARIRRMLNEYRIVLHEKEHVLARLKAACEQYVSELPQYGEAKNDTARRIVLANLMEYRQEPGVTEYRVLRDEVAWYKHEVSRIEVELEIARDLRRAMELDHAAGRGE